MSMFMMFKVFLEVRIVSDDYFFLKKKNSTSSSIACHQLDSYRVLRSGFGHLRDEISEGGPQTMMTGVGQA